MTDTDLDRIERWVERVERARMSKPRTNHGLLDIEAERWRRVREAVAAWRRWQDL